MENKIALMMASMIAITTPENELLEELIDELKEYKLLKASWNETKSGPAPEIPQKNISLFVLKTELEGKDMGEALIYMSEKCDTLDHAHSFEQLKKDI